MSEVETLTDEDQAFFDECREELQHLQDQMNTLQEEAQSIQSMMARRVSRKYGSFERITEDGEIIREMPTEE